MRRHGVDTVFIDMDGVIADFVAGACSLLDVDITTLPKGDYMFLEKTFPDMWPKINRNPDFWYTLPHINMRLIPAIRRMGYNVAILSSPADGSHAGKTEWCQQYYPSIPLFLDKRKEMIRGVLIDDYEINIYRYNAEWPGKGILFPARHNSLYMLSDGVDHVLEQL